MYGIEQKIIDWLKKLKTQPVSSDTNKEKSNSTTKNYSMVDSTNNKTTQNTSNETKSNNNVKSEMIETIKRYSDKLNGIVDDSFLQKMEYIKKTDEEIEEEASNYAQDKFNLSKTKLDGNIENKRQEYKQNEETIKNTTTGLKSNIEKKYENLFDSAQNKAIKNGISRSSILAETIKNLSEDKIQDYLNVDSEIAQNLKKNADELSLYEDEYNSAIKALEIQKAIQIKEKINELNEKQQKKIDEVLKYNNSIDEKIYKLKSQGNQLPSEKESAEYKRQMLNSALSYYYSLDPKEALEEFKNDVDVQYVLGGLSDVVENYLKNR